MCISGFKVYQDLFEMHYYSTIETNVLGLEKLRVLFSLELIHLPYI